MVSWKWTYRLLCAEPDMLPVLCWRSISLGKCHVCVFLCLCVCVCASDCVLAFLIQLSQEQPTDDSGKPLVHIPVSSPTVD